AGTAGLAGPRGTATVAGFRFRSPTTPLAGCLRAAIAVAGGAVVGMGGRSEAGSDRSGVPAAVFGGDCSRLAAGAERRALRRRLRQSAARLERISDFGRADRSAWSGGRLVCPARQSPESVHRDLPQHRTACAAAGVHPAARDWRTVEDHHGGL